MRRSRASSTSRHLTIDGAIEPSTPAVRFCKLTSIQTPTVISCCDPDSGIWHFGGAAHSESISASSHAVQHRQTHKRPSTAHGNRGRLLLGAA